MPDGRFLSKSIAYSAQVASVSFEADYLFARMIPFADREGRIVGEPLAIKGMCCPLRTEITADTVERALQELQAAKLIAWYVVDGTRYVALSGFAKHQRGARLDREAESRLPSPRDRKAEEVGSRSDKLRPTPPVGGKRRVSKVKESEVKRSEAKGREEAPPAQTAGASADVGDAGGGHTAKAPRVKRATWITPFADAWELQYGGAMSIEPNLKPLKTAVEKLGADESLRRWEIYLDQTSAKYASAARFAATLSEWEAPRVGHENAGVATSPESLARAATLFGLGRDHGLFAFDGNKATYGAAKAKAADDERAGASFDADLKASELWKGGFGEMPEALAIKEIARRLERSRNGTHGANGSRPEAKAS